MAAPHIPNLLDTLRKTQNSRGARSRQNAPPEASKDKDVIVQQTDDDAAGSRLSAVELGYLDDRFARAFSGTQETVRRMPIINRGTYVRATAIDELVEQFLQEHAAEQVQIISLGAGTDTRFFRLVHARPSLARRLRYHELDFASTTAKKIRAVEQNPSILSLLKPGPRDDTGQHQQAEKEEEGQVTPQDVHISPDKTTLASPSYTLHAIDLRDLAAAAASPAALPGVSSSAPTLILSECCLTYLDPSTSHALLRRLAHDLVPPPTPLHAVLYEPLHPDAAFGRTRSANLAARGLSMPGLAACPTLDAHAARLRGLGLAEVEGWEVKGWWDARVPAAEKERLRALEMVDEEEEWVLLAGHYGLVRGVRSGAGVAAA